MYPTDEQIEALHAEAVMARDLVMVALCDAALGLTSETSLEAAEAIMADPVWGPRVIDPVWGMLSDPVWTPELRAEARAECERVIREGQG